MLSPESHPVQQKSILTDETLVYGAELEDGKSCYRHLLVLHLANWLDGGVP